MRHSVQEPNLSHIVPELWDLARQAFASRNISRFLGYTCNERRLALLVDNIAVIRALGLYERALFDALIETRTNHREWPLPFLRQLLASANRERLLALGDPLPGSGPFTVYRGVAGRGPVRRIRGLSWTDSRRQAAWFARRFRLDDPAVFQVTVPEQAVMAYTNERNESEFIILLPATARPVRVNPALWA
jgi:hypothetical protein